MREAEKSPPKPPPRLEIGSTVPECRSIVRERERGRERECEGAMVRLGDSYLPTKVGSKLPSFYYLPCPSCLFPCDGGKGEETNADPTLGLFFFFGRL